MKLQGLRIDLEGVYVEPSEKFRHKDPHPAFRGTDYRGVSSNGSKWQVMQMIEGQKIYLITTKDVVKAAELYDLAHLQARGKTAKINFECSKAYMLALLFERSVVQVSREVTAPRVGARNGGRNNG